MHTAHRKTTYRKYKTHWAKFTMRPTTWNWTMCGKRMPASTCAHTIPEITCKTCRRRFAYWNQEDPR